MKKSWYRLGAVVVAIILAIVVFNLSASKEADNVSLPQAGPSVQPADLRPQALEPETASVPVVKPPVASGDIFRPSPTIGEIDQSVLPPDLAAQHESLPPDLPEDLRRQLESPPPELPPDLKAQLEAPLPPIPDDIKQALSMPPRTVTLDEVNRPAPE